MEDIILCKCYSCGKCYTTDKMVKIKIKESFEESMQIVKRYICTECLEVIKEGRPISEYSGSKKKDDFEVDF